LQQLSQLLKKTNLMEQLRAEYYSIWLRDRDRWDEVKLALDMLATAEQLIENMASEGEADGT